MNTSPKNLLTVDKDAIVTTTYDDLDGLLEGLGAAARTLLSHTKELNLSFIDLATKFAFAVEEERARLMKENRGNADATSPG